MSSKWKGILLKYGITALIGALMVAFVMNSYGFSEAETLLDKVLILANAFSIPGVCIFMFGFLVLAANDGFFDGISYAASYAIKSLIPGAAAGKQEKYADYVERKRGKGKTKAGFIFIVGLFYLVIAIGFTVAFYQIR